MLDLEYTSQFKKDLKLAKKRKKDMQKLKFVLDLILKKEKIPAKYKDHSLIGDYKDHRECHIEPDWLLIYLQRETSVVLVRIGSHCDLFE